MKQERVEKPQFPWMARFKPEAKCKANQEYKPDLDK